MRRIALQQAAGPQMLATGNGFMPDITANDVFVP
jgi:hypothetical protein